MTDTKKPRLKRPNIILEIIKDNPGIHVRGIIEKAGLKKGLLYIILTNWKKTEG